jgi:hypothetical protein
MGIRILKRAHAGFAAVALAISIAALSPASPALAHGGDYGHRDNAHTMGLRNGFRAGAFHGRQDAARRLNFNYWHDASFREATLGFRRSFGPIWVYRNAFRSGYRDGYTRAYREYRYRGHGRGGDRWDSRWRGRVYR